MLTIARRLRAERTQLLAVFARTIGRTVAVVAAGRVQAAPLQAWRGRAVILGLLAQCARIAQRANAIEFANHVHTLATVATGRVGALVDVRFAVASRVAGGAGATVVIDQINATGAILALSHAVVQILGTGGTAPTLEAQARERAGQIEAFTRIDAGSVRGHRVRSSHGAGQCRQQGGRATQIAANNGASRGGQQRVGRQGSCIGCLAFIHIHLTDIAAPLGRTFAAKAAD